MCSEPADKVIVTIHPDRLGNTGWDLVTHNDQWCSRDIATTENMPNQRGNAVMVELLENKNQTSSADRNRPNLSLCRNLANS